MTINNTVTYFMAKTGLKAIDHKGKVHDLTQERLSPDAIRTAYDMLYWKDFIATMSGWCVSGRRVSRILGKEIGRKYMKSWAYDRGFNG